MSVKKSLIDTKTITYHWPSLVEIFRTSNLSSSSFSYKTPQTLVVLIYFGDSTSSTPTEWPLVVSLTYEIADSLSPNDLVGRLDTKGDKGNASCVSTASYVKSPVFGTLSLQSTGFLSFSSVRILKWLEKGILCENRFSLPFDCLVCKFNGVLISEMK